jgi:hypothetical protein
MPLQELTPGQSVAAVAVAQLCEHFFVAPIWYVMHMPVSHSLSSAQVAHSAFSPPSPFDIIMS